VSDYPHFKKLMVFNSAKSIKLIEELEKNPGLDIFESAF